MDKEDLFATIAKLEAEKKELLLQQKRDTFQKNLNELGTAGKLLPFERKLVECPDLISEDGLFFSDETIVKIFTQRLSQIPGRLPGWNPDRFWEKYRNNYPFSYEENYKLPDDITSEKIFLEIPIYTELKFGKSDVDLIIHGIEFYQGTLDCFCVECKEQSIFRSNTKCPFTPDSIEWHRLNIQDYLIKNRDFSVSFNCARNRDHQLIFYFRVQNQHIIKTGQYPSIFNFNERVIGRYRNILGEEKYKELRKAIICHANGYGIAGFVYLRRIFENIIKRAYEEHVAITKDSLQNKRLNEKIEILRGYLPAFLVENKESIYGIMSKAVHELTEQDCLEFFQLIRKAIELILDQQVSIAQNKKEGEKTVRGLADISKKIRS